MVRANNFRPPTRSKKNRQTNRNYRVSNDRPDGGHDGDRGEDLPDLLRADALGEQSARHGVLKLYVYIFFVFEERSPGIFRKTKSYAFRRDIYLADGEAAEEPGEVVT